MSKETKVYFYKPEDEREKYEKEVSTVLNQTAEQLRDLLLSDKIPENGCICQIGVTMSEKSFNAGGKSQTDRSMHISKFHKNMKLLCLDPSTKITDGYFRIMRCQTNLMSGKCKCPFMANTVGKVLFPHWYDKEK